MAANATAPVAPLLEDRVNVALAANGATASASSSYTGTAASGTNNGDRRGLNYGQNGTWAGASTGFPQWLQIDFNGSKTIEEIDVFTLQDNWQYPSEPTEAMTFSLYGLSGYDVQYWNGSAWATVTGGSVTGNNNVWRKLIFTPVTTTKIRVVTNASNNGWSELTEVEAWTTASPPPPRTNVALAANGATASASSSYTGTAASGTNNGDRKGLNYGANGTWGSASSGFPQWLQIDFNGSKTVDEIDVFTLQDAYASPSEPTEAITFSLWGLSGYDVQYWNGSAWVTVTGGSVSGNNKVWRKFTFVPITTSKIRVWTNASPSGWSELTEVEAWGTPATSSGGSPSDFAMARLQPQNRTGTGGEDLLSNNFNFNLPLVGLNGRGLDLGFTLSYNSLVWTRAGNYMNFDLDQGSIAPGFRLGFPTIEGPYWNPDTSANFYLLVTPSGGRVELRQLGNSIVYESKDSTYLQLTDNLNGTMTLRGTDGSLLSFIGVNGAWRCNQAKDRNGNYITATYKAWGEIETVTDTLGRVLTFNYDTNANIQSITQTWGGQTHEWATFGWSTTQIGNNFPGLNNLGPNSTSIPVLTQVGLPDGSRFNFEYNNSYGIISTIRHYASDNHQRNYTTYVTPASASDCPRLTERRDWAENWSGMNGVPAEVVTSFGHDADSGCRMTLPDGTVHKQYYGSSWQGGLTTETRSYATVADANSNVWQKKTTTAWTQDNPNVGYLTNPRVTETNVYDASGNLRRVTIDYGSYVQWGLPHVVKEYDSNGATELRWTQTDYNLSQAYLDRRIIGLVSSSQLYDAVAAQWQAKVTYSYDATAINSQATTAVMHDQNYSASFTARGNVTGISRWDATDINNAAKALTATATYNAAGSVLSTADPATHTNSLSYAETFSDGNNSRNTFAYPTTVTDADGFSSTVQYNFDSGVVTRTQGPPPAGQPQGQIQTMLYDDALRLTRVTTENNSAYARYVYGPYWVQSFSTVNTIADEAYAVTVFDGLGRPFGAANNHPGSLGGYRLLNTIFDQMGRAVQRSNPTEINGSWVPVGDDAAGVVYSQQTYDWRGRPRITTNQDGTYKEASYGGCGCAGGEVVTLTDEVERQQRVYSDVLGRPWKTEILNSNGTVYSATTNSLNARDQATLVRQWAGAENGGSYQDTTLAFDGYGRLQWKHVPEQNAGAATVYAYNADDTIQSVTDARGASTTYEYNNGRHLISHISYQPPSGVADTPDVSFTYDAAGNGTSMTDGSGSTSYAYDSLSRMSSETRNFTALTGSYAINYGYNLAGALTSLTEPSQFGTSVSYAHDAAGRLSAVTGSGMQVSSLMSSLQYRASGALKHAAYGDGTELNLSYNERQLLTRYELNNVKDGTAWPYPYTTMGSQNQYHADGRVSYTQDLRNGNFDRGYTYDHAARLHVATSGREARGEPPANPADSPYKQTFSYDAWNNMGRGARLWTDGQSDNPTYTNNRRSDRAYDAEGHAVGGGWQPSRTHDYDAAGQQVNLYEESWSGPVENQVLHQNTVVQMYSGDGQSGKRIETRRSEDMQNHVTNEVRTVYFLRSSVLGGAVISELNDQGQIEGHVYVGGQKIADYVGPATNGSIMFRHANPSNGNWVTVQMPGNLGTRTEFDPLGASVGAQNPFPLYQSYNDIAGSEWLYNELGNPFDLASGCGRVDGMPISCSELQNRMDSGTVEAEFSGITINGRNGRVTARQPIRSYGVGLFGVWLPDGSRGNDQQWDFRLVVLGGGQKPLKPKPGGAIPGKVAVFDPALLDDCAHKLFGTDDNSSSFNGTREGGSFTARRGRRTLTVTFDTKSKTIANLTGKRRDSQVIGMYGGGPTAYIASDVASDQNEPDVYVTAVQVHETGNFLARKLIKNRKNYPKANSRYLREEIDDDPGMALEECVFTGGLIRRTGGRVSTNP